MPDAATTAITLPVITRTYTAEIINRLESRNWRCPTRYLVRISGPHGVHQVARRYKEFRDLHEGLSPKLSAAMPRMPKKRVLTRTCGGRFLENRQHHLNMLLQCIVLALPTLDDPILRVFLGLDMDAKRDGVCMISNASLLHCGRCPFCASDPRPADGANTFDGVDSEDGFDTEGCVFARTAGAAESVDRNCSQGSTISTSSQVTTCLSTSSSMRRTRTEPTSSFNEEAFRPSLLDIDDDSCPFVSRLTEPAPHTKSDVDSESINSSELGQDLAFKEHACIIARDVPRVFAGVREVDNVRMRILQVLRTYAQRDPEIGYTQGMCFAAAVVCLRDRAVGSAEDRFVELMSGLRRLWGPGFPMVCEGTPILVRIMSERDPELVDHFRDISLNFATLIPCAWLSIFAKWLPLESLLEIVPFLGREGFPGFLVVTIFVLLYNRGSLLLCDDLSDAMPFLSTLSKQPPPPDLLRMCEHAVPCLKMRVESLPLSSDL
eukprot:TRINITY_DN38718_c0_g1_i1.p1 TRINITY_DN38718_c0_g1~~TRINITY_DN38718_c0_g1_i1.p1  ORF type:complete len:491 (+),score=48.99 TRINITY_DN38718_c0_g1_i1:149-1621(+)